MSNEVAVMDRKELIPVLRASMYPGASDQSIGLVVSYCEAAKLDPMLKPVHIVPMKVKTGEKYQDGNEKYETRDVIMPGIGLYRVQAARTRAYAGVDEPVFGPTKSLPYKRKRTEWRDGPNGKRVATDHYDDALLEYPEWCKVTVYRTVKEVRCPYTAIEYWLENYATLGNGDAPNAMWAKRPHGQIAKCTEAQALRKAFPEVGSQPTAEEMEGKHMLDIDADGVTIGKAPMQAPQSRDDVIEGHITEKSGERQPGDDEDDPMSMQSPSAPAAPPAAAAPKPSAPPPASAPSGNSRPASVGEKANVTGKITAMGRDPAEVAKQLGVDWESLTLDGFRALKQWISKQAVTS